MSGQRYGGLDAFLAGGRAALDKGPVALIMAEDGVELDTTIRHHAQLGFSAIVCFAPPALDLPEGIATNVFRVDYDLRAENAVPRAVNRLIAAAPGLWFYYCYNAEYLFYPFCETRTVGEMLAFHTEERRDAMVAYVVDLYAEDLSRFPEAVSLETAMIDKAGYYALARPDPDTGHPKERQLDFFGGLRWRFEEHVPKAGRRIDRVALFRAQPGLEMKAGHLFNIEEYNTYACPWHHNLTAAICSFRAAKALRGNAGSRFDIHDFRWHNSIPFEWTSQQLLDLGLMEPGQWF
ncbi:hypothetical protein [Rhodovulum adriaticum]|uniref:Glycosyl transferase family 2 n=1 Tax=Rhodovulum adriaticum TaxID=35804 RepID=A0A4R2NHJ4_RHOAD|nr:hypothetical protein [Rhodovulum adriaticum]MBK1637122.1 hypothetical protein [Rhodovulum adriaticum]TCP20893.1 hypothetical protein EV656_11513 [Rhodovulum adriaticum]